MRRSVETVRCNPANRRRGLPDDGVIGANLGRLWRELAGLFQVGGDDTGDVFRRTTSERRDGDGNAAAFDPLGNVQGYLGVGSAKGSATTRSTQGFSKEFQGSISPWNWQTNKFYRHRTQLESMGLNFIFSDSLARIDACSALLGMGNGEALRTAAIAGYRITSRHCF